MDITRAQPEDAQRIAELHYNEIDRGFLRNLGQKFLTMLYTSVVIDKGSFAVIAKEGERIVGYIAGTTQVQMLYQTFFRKYSFRALLALIPKLFKIARLKKIINIAGYPNKKIAAEKLPQAELLSMAIDKEFQHQGVGQKLFERFKEEMQQRGIKEFKIIVGEELTKAIRFYEKVGCRYHTTTSIHDPHKKSKIYLYDLTSSPQLSSETPQ